MLPNPPCPCLLHVVPLITTLSLYHHDHNLVLIMVVCPSPCFFGFTLVCVFCLKPKSHALSAVLICPFPARSSLASRTLVLYIPFFLVTINAVSRAKYMLHVMTRLDWELLLINGASRTRESDMSLDPDASKFRHLGLLDTASSYSSSYLHLHLHPHLSISSSLTIMVRLVNYVCSRAMADVLVTGRYVQVDQVPRPSLRPCSRPALQGRDCT
jgi:hypothetical protein